MHPSDERLLAWVDGELSGDRAGEVEAHVAACEVCGRRIEAVAEEDRSVAAALLSLDGPVPTVSVGDVMRSPPPRAPSWGRGTWAAAVGGALLATGAAAAVGFPGIRSAVMEGLQGRAQTAPPAASVEQGGVQILAPSSLEVLLPTGVELGAMELRLTDDAWVRLEASASDVRFEVGPSSVSVHDAPAGTDFTLWAPLTLSRLAVRVGDRLLVLKDGETVNPPADSGGNLRIRLGGP